MIRVSGKTLTSNQYYGGMNRRHDRRARRLRRAGWVYVCIPVGDYGFTKATTAGWMRPRDPRTFTPVIAVMNEPNDAFWSRLRR